MTENIYFDTDCLSSFLCVGRESILTKLYSNRIMVPQPVYSELVRVRPFKVKIDLMISKNEITLIQIFIGTPEADLFFKLTKNPEHGFPILGKGEASAISLAVYNNGYLSSNNYKDIRNYIDHYELRNLSTGDIIVEAFHAGIINEDQGNIIWKNMIISRRDLPSQTFSDYLASKIS